jgi:hypothetical protein
MGTNLVAGAIDVRARAPIMPKMDLTQTVAKAVSELRPGDFVRLGAGCAAKDFWLVEVDPDGDSSANPRSLRMRTSRGEVRAISFDPEYTVEVLGSGARPW